MKVSNLPSPLFFLGFITLGLVQLTSCSSQSSPSILTTIKSVNNTQEPIVETPLGSVKGNTLQSREGRDYYAFYKVPYAKPPLGNLRFKSPQPAEPWEGILDEKVVAPQCIQKDKYAPVARAVGFEDCLYMNIYSPKLPNDIDGQEGSLMPTMFYIHGGGFTDGNGSRYGAKYFMDEDVVLINIQYRLGPFGFLSTNDGEITGNMAFKDQVMALKWVQDNVRYFGGDPDRVMIFGNSAGAISVSHHMISPMANGLFHTGISESGAAFCQPRPDSDQAIKTLESLTKEVGCSSTNQSILIECLRSKPAQDLAIVRTANITYNLIIENYETDDPTDLFMPDLPYNMIQSGRVNKVPWIIGVNSAEFVSRALITLSSPALIDALNSDFSTVANELLNLNIGGPEAETILLKIKDFYFGNTSIGNDTERQLTNLVSDRAFAHCSKVQASMQAEYSNVYLYLLSKEVEKSYADPIKSGFPPGNYGVAHADELQLLFYYNNYPEYPVDSPHFAFSRLLIKTWTQFAATGQPYSDNGTIWEPISPGQNQISWFDLNDNPQATTIYQSRMDLWDLFSHQDLNYAY